MSTVLKSIFSKRVVLYTLMVSVTIGIFVVISVICAGKSSASELPKPPVRDAKSVIDQWVPEAFKPQANQLLSQLNPVDRANADNLARLAPPAPVPAPAPAPVVIPTPAIAAVEVATAPAHPVQQPATPATVTVVPPVSPVERFVQDHLPGSLPDMTVGAGDHVANAILSMTNGAPTVLPAPADPVSKYEPLAVQLSRTQDLFVNKHLHADASGCGNEERVAQIQCAMDIVQRNAPAGSPKVPDTVLVARYGFNFHSMDAKGRPCAGYIAVTNYCDGQIQMSTIMMDSLAGNKKASIPQVGFTYGHEYWHYLQHLNVTQRTGNPMAYRDKTSSNEKIGQAAENDADTGGGNIVQSAISHGDLKPEDMKAVDIVLQNSGNKGVEGDTHATGDQRVAFAHQGGDMFLSGKPLPQFMDVIAGM